jgi:hypothetical protein
MKQKADHHLSFLADKNDRSATNVLQHLPAKYTNGSASIAARTPRQASESVPPGPPSMNLHSRKADQVDEDAAGESDDAAGEVETDFQDGAKRVGQSKAGSGERQLQECKPYFIDVTRIALMTLARAGRSASRDIVANGLRQNGHASGSRLTVSLVQICDP